MRLHRVRALALALLPAVAAAPPGPAPAGAGTGEPAALIRAADLLADVAFLASPRCAGRLPGTAGYDSACAFAERRFAALGLAPGGDGGGWRQHLLMEANTVSAMRLALLRDDGTVREAAAGDDFVCRGFTGAGAVTAPVVFVGYGLALPEQGWDDYAGADVAGKAVLAFKQPPGWKPPRGEWGEAHLPRPKAAAAAARGAAALLLVSLSDSVQGGLPIGSVLHGPGEQVPIPQLHLGLGFAEVLLAGSGTTLAQLRRDLDTTRQPAPRELSARVALEVRADHDPAATAANVVAVLPGRDPALAGQAVLVGAHLDHVGEQAGLLFPGANDNASGAAAVLAIARACAAAGPAPRTMVFALFAGEEQGLLGAAHLAARRPAGADSLVAMLNLDCVAHGDSIQLGSGRTSPRLWRLARDLDAAGARRTVARTWGGGGADATPFHAAGVPTLYFATTNSYAHLHRPTDTVDTLDGPLTEALVRLAYATARAVAEGAYAGEERPPAGGEGAGR